MNCYAYAFAYALVRKLPVLWARNAVMGLLLPLAVEKALMGEAAARCADSFDGLVEALGDFQGLADSEFESITGDICGRRPGN